MKKKINTILFSLFVVTTSVCAQQSYFSVNADSIAGNIPALNKEIDISVSGVNLQEFLRAVANTSDLNLNVDPQLKLTVTNNFHGVSVKDMLIFLERNYPIRVDVIGNIIDISALKIEEKIETDLKGVKYDSISELITLDYYKTNLIQVSREITKVTGNNIILAPSVAQQEVSGYVEKMPFAGALEQFAFSNDLKLRISETGYFILEPKPQEAVEQANPVSRNARPSSRNTPGKNQQQEEDFVLEVKRNAEGTIDLHSEDAPLDQVLQKVSSEMKKDYYLSTALEGTVSMQTAITDYNSFLNDVLKGTDYIMQEQSGIYIIGNSSNTMLRQCQVYQFQNRTIDDIIGIIPEDMKEGLMISEFPDLNSLLISGGKQRVERLTSLLNEIDKTVPVILIEVYIVNLSRNYTISTGIEAGIGETPISTQGKVFPGVDMQFGAEGINRMLEGFDGFGVLNIGNVTPGFYMTLKALEEQGILDVCSTPQLSTLNGHEATMRIGETEFYLEETNNFVGNENPILTTSRNYKSIDAELSLVIRPIVSGDDQITLNISVEQSDFTERISNEAPPGSVNRTFESIVRVKNQETIILGGLEEKRDQDSSTGTPFLSRIPIIKWLFSSRNKQTQNSKLNIFIKPTIIG